MLYSEFVERTGYAQNADSYHRNVEPSYYNYPGNKDEFCRDWLVETLAQKSENLREFQRKNMSQVMQPETIILWKDLKREYSTYVWHLAKLVKKLDAYYPAI